MLPTEDRTKECSRPVVTHSSGPTESQSKCTVRALFVDDVMPTSTDIDKAANQITDIRVHPTDRSCGSSNISTATSLVPATSLINGTEMSSYSIPSDLNITKAAARMRKYRHDHRNDSEWLNKESIRKRSARARRKMETKTVILTVKSTVLVPVDHLEYNRKEAERAREYRAVKRLDPIWKQKDAARMRLWRLKRKAEGNRQASESSEV